MKKSLIFSFLLLSIAFACKQTRKMLNDEAYSKLSDEEKRKVEHALDGIQLADPELEVTLFASEPMMMNPTNMDIDAKGRVWICEGYNYRNKLNPKNPYNKKGDRILIMEDTDQDGKADKSTVFYQGEDINAALGISVLGNKVIVSCSPNVFLFTDENSDGKADKKEIIFTNLKGVQHDHAIHAFSFGPDGKLYFDGGNEVETLSDKNGKELTDDLGRPFSTYKQGKVFRCDIDGSNVEILAHNFRNNYEVAVDSYGRMWQSDNDDDGNKGVRINYVMDYGNYGFKDEMTGASWQERRTNWESEIPLRHWHLNDPGVVPNLLQTGAGSPTGMIIYEGKLLPQKYHNQVIHCDAGPSIVRSYPAEKDGAGFKATINNILDGSKRDQWFRPSDVTAAPDGSIFVADWYDPGVGGHAMGDSLRGRIYRIAPKGEDYSVPKFDFETADGCVEALQNANLAVRYLAWTKLNAMQDKAEEALLKLWKGDDSRMRARALWLLGKINGKEAKYIQEAIEDKDEDIRLTGIRLSRELKTDNLPILKKLANDASPQIRREVAVAIRHKTSPEAAAIWTTLANQYDGKDRWYLEALGIAADNQWDTFFANYMAQAGEKWKMDAAAKDLVWRSRSTDNIYRLAELAKSEKENLRYFRAFDFQTNPEKTKVLLGMLDGGNASSEIMTLVFKHLDVKSANQNPLFRTLLPKVLNGIKNPTDYLDLVKRYEMKDQSDRLTAMVMNDSLLGNEAAKIQIKINGLGEFQKLAKSKDEDLARKAIMIYGGVDEKPVTDYLVSLFNNKNLSKNLRNEAMRAMNGWNSESILWDLVKANKVSDEVMPIAKKILLGTWHGDIRSEAMKMFGAELDKELGDINDLAKGIGNVTKGQTVFKTYCVACHQVKGEGVNFGPNLTEIGSKLSKTALYSAIINPSQGISFGYEGYKLKLKDGTEVEGMILSKTENDVNVKQIGSTNPTAFKRADIVSMEENEESLMPKFPLQKQEIVDLVEYLRTLKKQ
ncbi:PVC-type heme-binding CxxCH protein [Emticicia sp. SJ17W-69]|uniref:PVC-type heme-binding CxxCH protein n=1 Tax=Emticicia sp. SJ17W-69 TaxID=3421657 RepID=UPI003EBF4315